MGNHMPLAMVSCGEEVTIVDIKSGHGLTRRLADMGLVPGTTLKVVNSQMRGPLLVEVRSSRLVLGHGIAQKIMVKV